MIGPDVRLEEVEAGYGRRGRRPVLRGLSLALRSGEVTAVIGRNGAGKTTLARVVLGTRRHWKGTVTVGGVSPADHRRRHGVGYLPEAPSLPAGWTVERLLRWGCRRSGEPWTPGASGYADALGLAAWSGTATGRLSHGLRRRVALAWALTGRPGLLILDEPTVGLDPPARLLLRRVVRAVAADGATVLLHSHELDEVTRLADRAHLLEGGRLTSDFTGAALRADLLERAVAGGRSGA